MTTTNGTAAILATQGAREVVVASYVNYSPVLAMLRAAAGAGTGVSIICAGRDKQFALEDAACAGRYVRNIIKRLKNMAVSDAAYACSLIDRKYGDNLTTLFEESNHGKALIQGGYERDIHACAKLDAFPVVPIFQERQITLLGPNRER
jgi:2-phosphosulfolactate phosphatase